MRKVRNGQAITRRPGSGSMPRLSPVGMEHVAQYIRDHPLARSKKISAHLQEVQPGGEVAAPRTVRASLKRANFRYGRPYRKFVLTENAKNVRLVWSVLHSHDNFDRSVFTDEACFAACPDGTVKMWYPRREKPMVEQPAYAAKVHVLGAVSVLGTVGALAFADAWNAESFCEAIEENVIQNADAFFGQDNWSLQLDNATAHTAARAQDRLLQAGVPSLSFQPPSSPDLNPIENVWALLKTRIIQHNFHTAQQLRQALAQEWENLTPEEVYPFVVSMDSRVEAVRAAEGGHTHY